MSCVVAYSTWWLISAEDLPTYGQHLCVELSAADGCELFVPRGFAWLDTGTQDALLDASDFVRIREVRQGQKVGCPEEIAFRMDFIDRSQIRQLAISLAMSAYGQYLLELSRADT